MNCETNISQWHYPRVSQVEDSWDTKARSAHEKALGKAQLDKFKNQPQPESILKRPREDGERERAPKRPRLPIEFAPVTFEKERSAGVPAYWKYGSLMLSSKKHKTVSMESYMNQKHLNDWQKKEIAALQDKVCSYEKVIGSEDSNVMKELFASDRKVEEQKKVIETITRLHNIFKAKDARSKAEIARLKSEIARLKVENARWYLRSKRCSLESRKRSLEKSRK